MRTILIATAVEAEREAVLRGLKGDDRFHVADVGVGSAAASARTALLLAQSSGKIDLVVSAGIGGGFAGRAEVGTLVIADAIVAADLGAETPEGFRSVDELGFGSSTVGVDTACVGKLVLALEAAGLQVVSGPVLTVTTVTGTSATATKLAARVPGAAAEAMEGYGVAVAAELHGLPVIELRAISNSVGPRDRGAWRIAEALAALEAASALLPEVLISR